MRSTVVPPLPFSSDFNPIKQCWSKVQQRPGEFEARRVDFLPQAIAKAIPAIPSQDVSAWIRFRRCNLY